MGGGLARPYRAGFRPPAGFGVAGGRALGSLSPWQGAGPVLPPPSGSQKTRGDFRKKKPREQGVAPGPGWGRGGAGGLPQPQKGASGESRDPKNPAAAAGGWDGAGGHRPRSYPKRGLMSYCWALPVLFGPKAVILGHPRAFGGPGLWAGCPRAQLSAWGVRGASTAPLGGHWGQAVGLCGHEMSPLGQQRPPPAGTAAVSKPGRVLARRG